MSTVGTIDAYSISLFCDRFQIGRTKFYEEVKSGRLSARKIGTKTLILRPDAERWATSLPQLDTAAASEVAV